MKKSIYWLLLATLLVMPIRNVYADDGSGHDRLIIGQNFTLPAGGTVDGTLWSSPARLPSRRARWFKAIWWSLAGSLRLDGEAWVSAVVVGGSASLGAASSVGRDLVALGGSFERAEGSKIAGDIITDLSITTERLPRETAVASPAPPLDPNFRVDFGPLGTFAGVLFQALPGRCGNAAFCLSAPAT